MTVRGIRGATTADDNEREAILDATRELLTELVRQNDLDKDDIASAIFTVTEDLTAAFPAAAARQLGWTNVPLLDAREIPVPGALSRCIRVLLHVNTDVAPDAVNHVYLKAATVLREDLLAGRRIPR